MPACVITGTPILRMILIPSRDSARSETLTFVEVRIDAGVITGRVFDDSDEMSSLIGTCAPSTATGEPDVSLMTFVFSVRDNRGRVVGIFLTGVGFPRRADPTQLDFLGTWRAFTPVGGTPPIMNGQLEQLAIDPGDTGTGNGTQT
jgi:hypothetical protein